MADLRTHRPTRAKIKIHPLTAKKNPSLEQREALLILKFHNSSTLSTHHHCHQFPQRSRVLGAYAAFGTAASGALAS